MARHNILEYGAIGDNKTINTRFIQAAINDCVHGDEVIIPRGVFVSGSLFLHSNTKLILNEGAILKGSNDINDYPSYKYRFEGTDQLCYGSLLNTTEGEHENIEICGQGIIDGSGIELYDMEMEDPIRQRGRLICIRNTKNCIISGITVCNAIAWTIHFIFCSCVKIENISIYSRKTADLRKENKKLQNGDGIVIDSCDEVIIRHCIIDSQDDCISIKSGKNLEGRKIGVPSRNVWISKCLFIGGAGVSIGSEMSGGIACVHVKHCVFINVLSILSIKTNNLRGGYIRNISVTKCSFINQNIEPPNNNDYKAAIYINEQYKAFKSDKKDKLSLPIVENIMFSKIKIVSTIGKAIYINGLSDAPIKNIFVKNVNANSVGDCEIMNAEVFSEYFYVNGNLF